jgi:hypothetical protein
MQSHIRRFYCGFKLHTFLYSEVRVESLKMYQYSKAVGHFKPTIRLVFEIVMGYDYVSVVEEACVRLVFEIHRLRMREPLP